MFNYPRVYPSKVPGLDRARDLSEEINKLLSVKITQENARGILSLAKDLLKRVNSHIVTNEFHSDDLLGFNGKDLQNMRSSGSTENDYHEFKSNLNTLILAIETYFAPQGIEL